MSKTQHTPEPWRLDDLDITSGSTHLGFLFAGTGTRVPGSWLDIANTKRAIACVNACAGLDPGAVPDMRAQLAEAWRIINVLHMAQMDLREAWPAALEWLARNEGFRPEGGAA